MSAKSRLTAAKTGLTARWSALRARRPSVRHVVAAWRRMQDNNGGQYAAAITYFSFLALFPVLLLAVAVAGFVLHAHPAAEQSLFDHIATNVPGAFGDTLRKSIRAAIDARTGVGVVGLVGVLLTGLGWIGNLRAAVAAVWGRRPPQRNFVMAKVMNLVVLAGLGIGTIVSLALTAGGTALSTQVLDALSLNGLPGMHVLVVVVGVLLAVLGDMVIFSWLLVRLPGAQVRGRVALEGALLAAVGFEVLKIVGTYTIKRSASSPTAGPFAGIVAILVWIQLVARWMLLSAAWMSVVTDEEAEHERAVAAAASAADEATLRAEAEEAVELEPNPAAVGATVFGAGAVAGAAVTAWLVSRGEGRRPKRLTRA